MLDTFSRRGKGVIQPSPPASLTGRGGRELLYNYFLVRNEYLGVAGQQVFHAVGYVVGHEGFAVVLADVAVNGEAGFAAHIAIKLAGMVVFDDEDLSSPG